GEVGHFQLVVGNRRDHRRGALIATGSRVEDFTRCLWRSFFSSTIDAQFETGATHDMRIFIGSALLTVPARPSTHTPASASFKRRIFSSQVSPGLRAPAASFSCED